MKTGKTNKAKLKDLRGALHYYQMMVRIDLRAARDGTDRCREIAAKMRKLQAEEK